MYPTESLELDEGAALPLLFRLKPKLSIVLLSEYAATEAAALRLRAPG